MTAPTQGEWVLFRQGIDVFIADDDGGGATHQIQADFGGDLFVPIADLPMQCECSVGGSDRTYTMTPAEALANAQVLLAAPKLLAVCVELLESAAYWSEYDVPLGIVGRLRAAVELAGHNVEEEQS